MIVTLGNRAVHSHREIPESDALVAVRERFHFAFWLARTYGREPRPAPGLAFDVRALPTAAIPKQTAEQLEQLGTQLRERDEKLATLLADRQLLARRGRAGWISRSTQGRVRAAQVSA